MSFIFPLTLAVITNTRAEPVLLRICKTLVAELGFMQRTVYSPAGKVLSPALNSNGMLATISGLALTCASADERPAIGNDLYYVIKQNLDKGTLYRVPVLGGTPVKILEWIDAPVSFSPDGKRMVVVRGNYPSEGESALLIANADGTGEQVLARRKRPEGFVPIFFTGTSWSSDGELIATAVSKVGEPSQVVAFHVKDGKEQVLTKTGFPFIGRTQWLPDMSGLLVIAGNSYADPQVWLLSYPSGAMRQLTNDLDQHRAIGLSDEADKFVTVVDNGLVGRVQFQKERHNQHLGSLDRKRSGETIDF